MRTSHFVWAVVLFLYHAAYPPHTVTQEVPPPTPVDSLAWVRVTLHDAAPRQLTGILIGADSVSITVRPFPGGGTVVVPLPEVASTRLSLGRRTPREGLLRGAKHGLIGGLAVSALLVGIGVFSDAGGSCTDCFISATAGAVIVAVPLTAVTTAGGALLGAASPGERWVRVRVPVTLRPPRI